MVRQVDFASQLVFPRSNFGTAIFVLSPPPQITNTKFLEQTCTFYLAPWNFICYWN